MFHELPGLAVFDLRSAGLLRQLHGALSGGAIIAIALVRSSLFDECAR